MLLELRDAVAGVLAEQGKTDWAAQEFEHVRTFEAQPTRRDRWRRTSGIHKVRNRRALAAVRQLWTARDNIARRRDIAPGRILPDSAIIDAAHADPKTIDELLELPVFGGPKQRRSAQVWLDALAAGREDPDPPHAPSRRTVRRRRCGGVSASPRPPHAWRPPARASAASVGTGRHPYREPGRPRTGPPVVLGLDSRPPMPPRRSRPFLRDGGARAWQRELAVPVLAAALVPE